MVHTFNLIVVILSVSRCKNELIKIPDEQNNSFNVVFKRYGDGVGPGQCGPELVWNDGQCINVTDCKKPVLNNRECLDKCPARYLYIPSFKDLNDFPPYHYTVEDLGSNPCVSKLSVVIFTVSMVIITAVYCVLVWMYLCSPEFFTLQKIRQCCLRRFRPVPLLINEEERTPLLNDSSERQI